MAGYIPTQQSSTGSFIPTTQVWNVNEIYDADLDPKLQELFVRMYQNLGLMSDVLNAKDFALYLTQELANSQNYYTTSLSVNDQMNLRPVFRLAVNTGAVPANSTVTKAHGLTIGSTWNFTRIYGTANYYNSAPTSSFYAPLPYADATNSGTTNIELYADGTNVYIINNTSTSFTGSNVVLEYCKF